jgi:hypothetical protein
MPLRPLKSFLPTADDVLKADLPTLGEIVLQHLKSYEGLNTVWQHGGLNRGYFLGMLENRNMYLGVTMPKEPEYGNRQPEVTEAVMGAWNWLVGQGMLIPNHNQPGSEWFLISRQAEELLTMEAALEKLGLDRVKADLLSGAQQVIGGNAAHREKVWEWVRRKENKPPMKFAREWELIAESRLAELRALKSPDFDFKKLIRLCEELNIAAREGCHFAVGMLTRALLDQVPPLFGVPAFNQLASYSGGSKSFKDTMLHLDTAAKKIADGLLHTQIRKSEMLPNAQQVNFAPALDLLLGEIVRINL